MTPPARLACTLLIAAAVTPAVAGPPYATDDPDPTDRGRWEIYAFGAGTQVAGGVSGETGLDFNYGGADQVQLTLVLPLAFAPDLATRLGAGSVELAVKYRFLQADPAGTPLSVAIFPRVFLPSAAAGLGPRRTQLLLPLWAGRTVGDWTAFGGGGYEINPGSGSRDFWTGGFVLTRALSERMTIGAERYGQTPDAVAGRSRLAASLGLTLVLRSHWSLLASAGPGLAHAAGEGRYAGYLALKADY